MKNISNQNIIFKDKKVLLRVDLNVPMKDGSITESSRIKKIIPTIKMLLEKEAKIIILSHIGRPKGKIVQELSLEPISKKLSSILNLIFSSIVMEPSEILSISDFVFSLIGFLLNKISLFNKKDNFFDIGISDKFSLICPLGLPM